MCFQFLFTPNWDERNALCNKDEEVLICSGQKRGPRRLNPVWRQPYIRFTFYGRDYRTAITITVPSINHSYPVDHTLCWYGTTMTRNLLACLFHVVPSWEADLFSASQEIPRVLLKPKVHYRIYKRPVLSQLNPVHAPHPTSWRFILILSSHLRLGLPSGLFPSGFPTKTLYTPLLSPSHVLHGS